MIRHVMTCGCVAQGVKAPDGTPICITHGCEDIAKEIDTAVNPKEGLEGRHASCIYCKHETESAWSLPFFVYRPERDTDDYYDGCYGWD